MNAPQPLSVVEGSLDIGTRLALRREEAARALGISDESFDRYIRAQLPTVRVGTIRLYPVEALNDWLREHASAVANDLAGVR